MTREEVGTGGIIHKCLHVYHFPLPLHELHGLVEVARETVGSKERQWGSKDIHEITDTKINGKKISI